MFEHGGVSPAAATLTAEPSAATVAALQQRISAMQATKLDSRRLPTHPALANLLDGGLKQGAAYSVERSATLLMAMLSGPSAAGSWCAVVGVPEFGIEAAERFGIDLERLVLVPHPGQQWMTVVSALVDVVSVVLVRPPVRDGRALVPEAAASKLAARLRQREAVLVSIGDWPRADAALTLSESDWAGLGSGFGHLTARQVTVSSASASWQGRVKSRRLWLPDASQAVSVVLSP